VAQSSKRR